MKRLWLAATAIVGVSVAVVLSGVGGSALKTFFPKENVNPVTHLRWNENESQFQFVIVSDRTGGHRPEIFSRAVEKINLMQPAFVLSVGDLIEGGKKPEDKIAAEWKEFDGLVNKLNMPFFYVPGNHDTAAKETSKVWQDKLGRSYYHFVYRNVLFLVLHSNNSAGTVAIGKEQIAYAQKALTDNANVSWTIVALHHPLWVTNNGAKNGWADVEKLLAGRNYSVFCGHVHRYEKWVRQGMNYYQLATTGGSSRMRGMEYNEFDHFVWVTMKQDGPVLANIMIDGVHNESLQVTKHAETGVSTANRKPTFPVNGKAYFDGVPMAGAFVTFTAPKVGTANPLTATGLVEPDGSFKLSTYKAFDGAPAGEYRVSFAWRESGRTGPSLIPVRYNTPDKSGLQATVQKGANDVVLELRK